MGVTTTTAILATTAVAGGALQVKSAMTEANALEKQGELAAYEAGQEAARLRESARQFQATQKMKYVMSGVIISDTPIQVLDDTKNKADEQIDSILKRGEAKKKLTSDKTKTSRREALAGFVTGTTKTVGGALK